MKIEQNNFSIAEIDYLSSVLSSSRVPNLEGIWALIDAAWDSIQCDPRFIDERISKFYAHPVWLLNGLFIEQDTESLNHRQAFATYIVKLRPNRVADFGGGYGSLARMIGEQCPNAEVHIIEPHPHNSAVLLAERTPNVRYKSEFLGQYDVLIATDVFEHVLDPLSLIASTAAHLRLNGEYLIANCFWPVIKCHLPSTFHFRWSWDAVMTALNLLPLTSVAYGRAYRCVGPVILKKAREVERQSKRWFPIIERIPKCLRARAAKLLWPRI